MTRILNLGFATPQAALLIPNGHVGYYQLNNEVKQRLDRIVLGLEAASELLVMLEWVWIWKKQP